MLTGPNITGGVSEAMVVGYLVSQGYEVFDPVQPHTRADLVYIRGGNPLKVQVKTANWFDKPNTGHRYEQCVLKRTHSAEYTPDEIDEFWIVGTHLWRFPFDAIGGLVCVSLGTTNPRPRKTVRHYNPNDFIVVHGSLDFPYRDRLVLNSPVPFVSVTNGDYAPETLRKMKSS